MIEEMRDERIGEEEEEEGEEEGGGGEGRRREVETNGLIKETFAKGFANAGVLDGILETDTRVAIGSGSKDKALMVKVVHDGTKSVVLLDNEVSNRDFDILKRDISRCR